MKLLSSHFAAPVVLAVLSVLAGCSSDNPAPPGSAGSSSGGSGGKAGSSAAGASAAGASAAGASAAGASAAGASAGGTGGLATAGSGGASTAGAAGGTAVAAMTFTTLSGIIKVSCFGNGCHGQEGNPLQMSGTDDAKLYTTLTTHMTQKCGKLVNTASPAQSALVKLLQGDCNGTNRMPFQTCFDGDTDPDSPCIQPDKIAGIQAWIAKGALKD